MCVGTCKQHRWFQRDFLSLSRHIFKSFYLILLAIHSYPGSWGLVGLEDFCVLEIIKNIIKIQKVFFHKKKNYPTVLLWLQMSGESRSDVTKPALKPRNQVTLGGEPRQGWFQQQSGTTTESQENKKQGEKKRRERKDSVCQDDFSILRSFL